MLRFFILYLFLFSLNVQGQSDHEAKTELTSSTIEMMGPVIIDDGGGAAPLGCCWRCSNGKIVSLHKDVTEAYCESIDGGPGYHYYWTENDDNGKCPHKIGDDCPNEPEPVPGVAIALSADDEDTELESAEMRVMGPIAIPLWGCCFRVSGGQIVSLIPNTTEWECDNIYSSPPANPYFWVPNDEDGDCPHDLYDPAPAGIGVVTNVVPLTLTSQNNEDTELESAEMRVMGPVAIPLWGCCIRVDGGQVVNVIPNETEWSCQNNYSSPNHPYHWVENDANGNCPHSIGDPEPAGLGVDVVTAVTPLTLTGQDGADTDLESAEMRVMGPVAIPLWGCCYRSNGGVIVSIHENVTEWYCQQIDGGPGFHYYWVENDANGDCPYDIGDPEPVEPDFEVVFALTEQDQLNLQEDNLAIFPNPNDGNFNITLNTLEDNDLTVRIFDASGKQIYQNTTFVPAGQYQNNINLSENLSSGLYYISAMIGNETISKKIIVNR